MPNSPTPFICSPLGLVPKGSGGWRRIHHLSYPRGNSVNDHIPAEWAALEYATVDQAIALVAAQGPRATLIKRDLQDAFRHIPIAPQDLWLLGFCWEDTYWVDCFLPFGLRTAPYIFDLFAKALHWILDTQATSEFESIHYLDDFLSVGPQSAATEFSHQFEQICNRLGLRIKESKSITGTTADLGGIELDTLAMEARLPPAKLQKATELVEHALKKGTLSLQELQSLIGFLSFCCKVVPLGRSFLRRLYDATSDYPTGNHPTSNYPHTGTTRSARKQQRRRLTADIKADLRWWKRFLPSWNGIAIIRPSRATLLLWTDASGNEGLGGYFLPGESPPSTAAVANNPTVHKHTANLNLPTYQRLDDAALRELTWSSAFSKPHPRRHRHKHINYKEMLAILTAFRLWLTNFSCKHLAIHTDNTAVYHGLNKRSMRGPAMEPLREITLLAAQHDITFSAHWIPTKDNQLADLLSRRQFTKIAELCPLLSDPQPKQ
jgi:hypothetical protein